MTAPPGELVTRTWAPGEDMWQVTEVEKSIQYVQPDVTVRDLGLHRSMMLLNGEHSAVKHEDLKAKQDRLDYKQKMR